MSKKAAGLMLLAFFMIPLVLIADPPPKKADPLAISNLRSLLGKNHFSKEAHDLRDRFKTQPVAQYFSRYTAVNGILIAQGAVFFNILNT